MYFGIVISCSDVTILFSSSWSNVSFFVSSTFLVIEFKIINHTKHKAISLFRVSFDEKSFGISCYDFIETR